MPQEYLVRGLEVLSDMVLEPLLESREIEKEKTVVIEEIKMYKDQPQSYVYELLDGLMWPGQPLGEPIIGSAESVSGFNRERLARFQNDCYTAQNIVISAAGALDCDKLRKKVRSIFSGLNRGCRNMFIPACQKQLEPKLNIFFKDTEQTHMAMGFHSFSRSHRLRHALSILHIILGANMSSRLFEQVREKRGLAYEIGTAIKRFADTGAFIVHAGIDNRKVEPAIELILSQLRKARTKKVSVGEFRRAKEFYLGQLRLALEDTLDYMLWLGEQEATLGQPYRLEQVIEEVNKVTRGNIIEAAKLVFQNRGFSLALIGPLKAAQEKIRKKLCIN
jgi:predicted Zn-dependent peptidase